MNEKQQPWGKWFWGDWRKDARLRRCCYAARGLWADMLSLMGGECDRFGYLMMEGQALGPGDLVGLLGGSEREVGKLLSELEGKRVFSRTGASDMETDLKGIVASDLPAGVIFSRRMLRDKAKAERDRENGKGGGNPTLKGSTPKSANRDNGVDNPPHKAQKLEPEAKVKEQVDSPNEPAPHSEFVEGPENPEFIEFFFAFPKQEGGKDASKIYFAARRDKGVSRETLLDGAKRYTAHLAAAGQKLRYAQKAETWLKAECWNDRYDTEVKASAPPVAVDPSWGDRAQKLSAAVEPKFFDAYFAAAEFVDSDPPCIRFKSRSAKELAERKCGRALKSTFGEIMLEVRA